VTWETILVDGVDISSAARIIQVWDGAHTSADLRGGDLVVPGRDGVVAADRPFDVATLSIGMQVRGSSLLTGFNDELRTLVGICKPGRTVTLSRRMSYSAGNETHTATGRYLSGLTPSLATPALGKLVVNFAVLSGVWHGSSVSVSPGTVTIAGEVRTKKITLTLPGAGTLTNSTTGVSVTVTAAATLDVEAGTSTGTLSDVVASGDPLGAWFTLVPGSNTITWSGAGTPTIAYRPAYL
jgi:hypothetical protein